MKNNLEKVLKACIARAKKGKTELRVFDIMYDTSLAYPDLKAVLDELVEKGELVAIDLKTYKFVGDINREFNKPKKGKGKRTAKPQSRPDADKTINELMAALEEIDCEKLRRKALRLAVGKHTVSAYALQQVFSITYGEACEILDWMREKGYISCERGKPTEVLLSLEEFKKLYGDSDESDDIFDEELNSDLENEKPLAVDEDFRKALKYCIDKNFASVSALQRAFPIGYIRACKIIDWMESKGYISPQFGSKPREVLITPEEFKKLYGNGGSGEDDGDDGQEIDFNSLFDCLFTDDEDDSDDED